MRRRLRLRDELLVDVAADEVHALVRGAPLVQHAEGLAQRLPAPLETLVRVELVEAVLQPHLRVHPPPLLRGRSGGDGEVARAT